jgi:serine/threonine protein kinase
MQLRHQNILQLIGFTVVDGAFALITPWMERGDLRDYLKASTDVDVCCIVRTCAQGCMTFVYNCVSLLQALGVASGLAYLHSVGVVHANLRTVGIPSTP